MGTSGRGRVGGGGAVCGDLVAGEKDAFARKSNEMNLCIAAVTSEQWDQSGVTSWLTCT
jgi:hypothetical protein